MGQLHRDTVLNLLYKLKYSKTENKISELLGVLLDDDLVRKIFSDMIPLVENAGEDVMDLDDNEETLSVYSKALVSDGGVDTVGKIIDRYEQFAEKVAECRDEYLVLLEVDLYNNGNSHYASDYLRRLHHDKADIREQLKLDATVADYTEDPDYKKLLEDAINEIGPVDQRDREILDILHYLEKERIIKEKIPPYSEEKFINDAVARGEPKEFLGEIEAVQTHQTDERYFDDSSSDTESSDYDSDASTEIDDLDYVDPVDEEAQWNPSPSAPPATPRTSSVGQEIQIVKKKIEHHDKLLNKSCRERVDDANPISETVKRRSVK